MATYIIKLEGRYLEWSTIVDAPVSFGVSYKEFKADYLLRYGITEMEEFEKRMERVETKGTSAIEEPDVDSVIWNNRAGVDETCLSKEQLIQYYVRDCNPVQRLPFGVDQPELTFEQWQAI